MPIIIPIKELEKLKHKRRLKKAQSIRASKKAEREFRRQISDLWMKVLLPTTQKLRGMVRDKVPMEQIALEIERALKYAESEYAMASYNLIDRWRSSLDQENRWKLNDALKKTLSIDTSVIYDDPIVAEGLKIATMGTANLITSIPEQYLGQVAQSVYDNFVGKELPEGRSLEQQILHLGNVSRKRAHLIARDQTSKTTGTLNQIRQQAIGIEEYI